LLQIWTNKILARIRRREFSSATGVDQSIAIAISQVVLQSAANSISSCAMQRWRSSMRELSAEARQHLCARSLSGRIETRIEIAALYGALALIAAIVFGTLSVHPF
jgi:hypothetical protein